MENKEDHLTNKENPQHQANSQKDEAGYTPQEDQFADGKGTQLNEEIDTTDDNNGLSPELEKEVEGTFEDQDFGKEEGIQPDQDTKE